MWSDLGLNIIAELLGIAITVFVIDRLLQWREKQRWEPLKDITYGRLYLIGGKVLMTLLPPSMIPPSGNTIYFGKERIVPSIESIPKSAPFLKDVDIAEAWVNRFGGITANSIGIIRDQLMTSVQGSYLAIDPNILYKISLMETMIVSLHPDNYDWDSQDTNNLYAVRLLWAIRATNDLMHALEPQITKRRHIEDVTE